MVKISALKRTGVKELISLLNEGNFKKSNKKIYENDIEELLTEISKTLKGDNKRFTAVKILERDEDFVNKNKFEKEIAKVEKSYGLDTEQLIANQRYNYIVKVKQKVVVEKEKSPSITDKLDKVFLNKWLAIPIFVAIMALVYYLSVGVVGTYTVDLVDGGVTWFSETVANWLTNLNASEWAVSLLCDGMIAGVGAVLTFVPQLIILFICIALLETTGYMSRISFFFDRLFRKFGLSGKSLVPFIVGSGCSVPAIMTTRTIEDENERNSTIMFAPPINAEKDVPATVSNSRNWKLPSLTHFAYKSIPLLSWMNC